MKQKFKFIIRIFKKKKTSCWCKNGINEFKSEIKKLHEYITTLLRKIEIQQIEISELKKESLELKKMLQK